MTVKSRTIDNLGIETSSRYARDQAQLDTKLIDESRFIPLKTEVSVVKPYLPTEFEEYFSAGTLTLWASFEPPPEYYTYAKPLFSYQLIPSLGSYEKQEADEDKLEALEDTLNKSFQEGKRDQQQQKEEEDPVESFKDDWQTRPDARDDQFPPQPISTRLTFA